MFQIDGVLSSILSDSSPTGGKRPAVPAFFVIISVSCAEYKYGYRQHQHQFETAGSEYKVDSGLMLSGDKGKGDSKHLWRVLATELLQSPLDEFLCLRRTR